MTALAIGDQFDAYAAELVITPTEPEVARRASLVVCGQSTSTSEARQMLEMLGLLPAPGHGRIGALLKHMEHAEDLCPACRVLLADLVQGEHVRVVAA